MPLGRTDRAQTAIVGRIKFGQKLLLPSDWAASVTRKKSPKVFKRCLKMISLENDRF